jgi:hypothetical protein
MTLEQEQHLQHIKDEFVSLVDPKYRKGQSQHGGDLFTKSASELVDMALDEAIDQVVYLLTLREKLCP